MCMCGLSKINILLDNRRMGGAFSLSIILLSITSFSLIVVLTSSLRVCLWLQAHRFVSVTVYSQ